MWYVHPTPEHKRRAIEKFETFRQEAARFSTLTRSAESNRRPAVRKPLRCLKIVHSLSRRGSAPSSTGVWLKTHPSVREVARRSHRQPRATEIDRLIHRRLHGRGSDGGHERLAGLDGAHAGVGGEGKVVDGAVGTLSRQNELLILETPGPVRQFVLAGGQKVIELEQRRDLLGQRLRISGKLHPTHANKSPGLTVERWMPVSQPE